MNKIILVVCVTCFFLGSCASPVNVLKPYGENVNINFKGNKSFYGELIHVTDSTFTYYSDNEFILASYDSLYSMYVTGYKVDTKGIVLFISMLADVFLGVPAFGNQGSFISKILVVAHAAGILWAFSKDIPRSNFIPPFSEIDIAKLREYSRYPDWYPTPLLKPPY